MFSLPDSLKPYAKAVAAVVAAIAVAAAAFADGTVTSAEVAQIVAAFGGSGLVYGVTNK